MSAIVGAANVIGGVAASAATSVGWFIPMLVAAIAYYQYETLLDPESKPIDIQTEDMLSEYDFIIIGAGSAGKINSTKSSQMNIFQQSFKNLFQALC